MQVAVDQYLVNRHRQRAAKGIAGIGPAFSVERVTTGGFDIGTSVTKQPLQIARHSIKAKISFTVTAGIRRGALLALTFSCNTMVSVSPILRGRRSSNSG